MSQQQEPTAADIAAMEEAVGATDTKDAAALDFEASAEDKEAAQEAAIALTIQKELATAAPPPPAEEAPAPIEEVIEIDPLSLGNVISIFSAEYGYVTGRVIYRDDTLVRLLPMDASDRAIDFPLVNGGADFAPDLGVTEVTVDEPTPKTHFVDLLGAQPGDMLEFFDTNGRVVRPPAQVADVIRTPTKDSIQLADGTLLRFRGIGPTPPIAVIRVRTTINAPAALEQGAPIDAATPADAVMRREQIMSLLQSIQAADKAIEIMPMIERTYPDSMQREDMFQDLLAKIPSKQKSNPRRVRGVEREVDLLMSLKSEVIAREPTGRIIGTSVRPINTLSDILEVTKGGLPSVIPVVDAARVLNLDDGTQSLSHKKTDVVPRSLPQLEEESEAAAQLYLEGGSGATFAAYMYDLLSRDAVTLQGSAPTEWTTDQDVIRTAGLGEAVQGLSIDPSSYDADDTVVSLAQLSSDTTDRNIRVLGPDRITFRRMGRTELIAPSDPSVIKEYMVLPTKAAIKLRPPTRPGNLPMALLYSANLEDDNLPTIAQTLRDLYAPAESATALNVVTLTKDAAESTKLADWLKTVLKYAVHPVDSLGPRTPMLLSLLDTLGLGNGNLSSDVTTVIDDWVRRSQQTWRDLLSAERKRIQAVLDEIGERTFQSVVGENSPTWMALSQAAELKEILADIERRNPAIYGAPLTITSALLTEAQGDSMPIVWNTLAKHDGRDLGIDMVVATEALQASRAYILRRTALRDYSLYKLFAEPELNTCPHVNQLEAIRNISDPLQRARLLREFIEQYQGGRNGNWVTCVVCRKDCVCYHEIVELEALAQPTRMESIQKQILIRFGGERFEGKIICKNCGQGLQDIDYDEHVEFDDDGRPISQRSVLTDEQMEEPSESSWKKATADILAAPMKFATEAQRTLSDILYTILNRSGLQATETTHREIVGYADKYLSARTPAQAAYEAARTKALTSAAGASKAAQLPPYSALLDQLRVSALSAAVVLALQSATEPLVVNNPYPICKFGRGGWPLNPDAKPDDEVGALNYIACVVASFGEGNPWSSMIWASQRDLQPRRRAVVKVITSALLVMLGADPKSAPLSFTPQIQEALAKAREDTGAKRALEMRSLQDQIPIGFKPAMRIPTVAKPVIEKNPLPAVVSAIEVNDSAAITDMATTVEGAVRQQAIHIMGELNDVAVETMKGREQSIATTTDATCCAVSLGDADKGALLGVSEQSSLVKASILLQGAVPTAVKAGTHLWPVFEPPVQQPVAQNVEEGVLFKLFLKYCYTGPQVGRAHEFSVGNICRKCGLRLGKPVEFIDFSTEGAGILAAQQGALKVEVTQSAFDGLSRAVRIQKTLAPAPEQQAVSWRAGLEQIVRVADTDTSLGPEEGMRAVGARLAAVLAEIDKAGPGSYDDVKRALLWGPIVTHMDALRSAVIERVGPMTVKPGSGGVAAARAKEATMAITMFDTMTDEPFIEGPRAVQEYWCAKVEAAGNKYAVSEVQGAKWFKLSEKHNERINKILSENAGWYGGDVTEEMLPVLRRIGISIGPILRTWVRDVRASTSSTEPWTVTEAQLLLRTVILQAWHDAVVSGSWMYREVPSPQERDSTAAKISNWTRALMYHVKQQFVRFSKDKIKQVLQQRATLERTMIVKEFTDLKDDDLKGAYIVQKRLKFGRWGADVMRNDPDVFDFFVEQQHRMGVVEAPVDPVLLEGAAGPAPAAGDQWGFGADDGAPEDGYDVDQGADGDNY